MIKKILKKTGEKDIFLKTKRLPQNEIWTQLFFVAKAIVVGTPLFYKKKPRKKEFSKKLKKFSFLFEKWIQIKKSKNDERTFFDAISNIRNSEINFL